MRFPVDVGAVQVPEVMYLWDQREMRMQENMEEVRAGHKQADEQLRLLKDQYRRLQADFDNFRSRAVRCLLNLPHTIPLDDAEGHAFYC
jgi:molecular chaperone GrpE (heat shock protein)